MICRAGEAKPVDSTVTTTKESPERGARAGAQCVDAASIHEAGHAVVCFVVGRRVGDVRLQRVGDSGGYNDLPPRAQRRVRVFRELPNGAFVPDGMVRAQRRRTRDEICVLLAGREAERQIVPELMRPDSDKYDQQMIRRLLPNALALAQSAEDLLPQLTARTANYLHNHRDEVIHLAAHLLAKGSATAAQITAFWRGIRRAQKATQP